MDVFEKIQQYLSQQKNGFAPLSIVLGAFLIWSAIANWNWIYQPPYNVVKNPIGYWFGRKAFRITFFVIGLILLTVSAILIATN